MQYSPKYVVISPVRDEEEFIEYTIESVISQTVRPLLWVIVNDGSKDKTGEIAEAHCHKHEWIQKVDRNDRGYRKRGGGVVDAFNFGMTQLGSTDYDFIGKLDGDLSFDKYYFEKLLSEFSQDPKLGIGGGACYNKRKSAFRLEKVPTFHVRGATKVYRRKCFEDIGGLESKLGWDTIDEIKANMLGWKSRSFPELKVVHYRETGAASKLSQVEHGRGDYLIGYHPVYMLLKAISRIPQKPFLIGSLLLLYGFLSGYFRKEPRLMDGEVIKYLRQQQMNRIFMRETIWK
jgi:glycosyltransferase involved in cell wall biosynthesis